MTLSPSRPNEQTHFVSEIYELVANLGKGKIHGVAYDTAWVARLAPRYPGYGFEKSVNWLRRNQHEDGTWGASLMHYHDRFASTLAATVALKEVSESSQDEKRVGRGENALWRLVGRLGRDDSDTVGFPVVSASLTQDALALGLNIPRPPVRYAATYQKKVQGLLTQTKRDWRTNVLSFSLEGLWRAIGETDTVLEANHSVASSPAATAAYLLVRSDTEALKYLQTIMEKDGSIPHVAPIDIFEIIWSLNYLYDIGVVEPNDPDVKPLLDHLWQHWSPITGSHFSTYFRVPDLDITCASFILLRWGGYPVEGDVFEYFEMDDYFCTYRDEANPSTAAHLRLLLALQACPEHPKQRAWVQKVLNAIQRFDENGSYWWDKWHSSPYYVTHLAIRALLKIDTELAKSRLNWIIKTQNDDGGWGYLDHSTIEETAYCIKALLMWHDEIEPVDSTIFEKAINFLRFHNQSEEYTPLWISKALYAPHNIVKSVILSTLYQCREYS